jgi:hypothetical protein
MNSQPPVNGRAPRFASLRAALTLLAGSDHRVDEHDGRWVRFMWLWVGLLGVAWGLLMAGAWAAASAAMPWWGPGGGMPLTPVAALVALLCLTPLHRVVLAAARQLRPECPVGQAVAAAGLVAALTLCLLWIVPYYRERTAMPAWLAWARPMAEYRLLVLMPMWGAWAMMVPCHFCQSADNAGPLVRSFVKRQPVAGTAMWMAIPLAGTLWELNFLGGWTSLPAALALATGGIGGALLCRGRGGVTRGGLLAMNWLTQMVVLVGYLAAKSHT